LKTEKNLERLKPNLYQIFLKVWQIKNVIDEFQKMINVSIFDKQQGNDVS